jgi:hypothetical protein
MKPYGYLAAQEKLYAEQDKVRIYNSGRADILKGSRSGVAKALRSTSSDCPSVRWFWNASGNDS